MADRSRQNGEVLNNPINVLVVDDSAFARTVITNKLQSDPDIRVIGAARDGVEHHGAVRYGFVPGNLYGTAETPRP